MSSFWRTALTGFSPRTIGIAAAVVTVLIWTGFIIIARASADPTRGGTLSSFDIVFCRIVGASLVLLPWGSVLAYRDRARGINQSSLLGLSPLSLRVTATVGLFGGLLYAPIAYNGFVFAPAAHALVLLPGSLPLWTALLAALILHDHITATRALGLGLIVLGDVLEGGASLLRALDGGEVWKGDLLFMLGDLQCAVASLSARRGARHHCHHRPCFCDFCAGLQRAVTCRCGAGARLHSTLAGTGVSGRLSGLGFGGNFGYHVHQNDSVLWPGALNHDYRIGTGALGLGRGVAIG